MVKCANPTSAKYKKHHKKIMQKNQRFPLKPCAVGVAKGRTAILPLCASKSFAFEQHINI